MGTCLLAGWPIKQMIRVSPRPLAMRQYMIRITPRRRAMRQYMIRVTPRRRTMRQHMIRVMARSVGAGLLANRVPRQMCGVWHAAFASKPAPTEVHRSTIRLMLNSRG